MCRYFSINKFILLFACLIFNIVSFAGKDKKSDRLYGSDIKSGVSKLVIEDVLYPDLTENCRIKGSEAIISLNYDYSNGSVLESNDSYTVEFVVNYIDELGNSHTSDPFSLNIGDNKDRDLVVLENAYRVSIDIISPSTGSLPAEVYFEATIETERYYDFDYHSTPYELSGLDAEYLTLTNEIRVFWEPLVGAESYELEYTYVDDYDKSSDNQLTAGSLTYEFDNNSTRVRLNESFYKFPLVYDRGFVLYRVRGIGRGGNDLNKDIVGKWSSDVFTSNTVDQFSHKLQVDNYNLNYQANSSFAENGKRKDVVNYFDGSLRGRQTLTKSNTSEKVIVGEKVYDYEGRPAITVLPAPVINDGEQNLKYHQDFNENASGNAYSKTDFGEGSGGNCQTFTEPMSTSSGASLYYSSSNPENSGHNAYIPDAEGYPFSQTEFEPDNSGRIKRQSGVGDLFKLSADGTGKETRYFYGQPEQEELDRLFGNNAGYAGHYKKNMVIDPNGQVSVSFLDAAGNVVATSLAGEASDVPNLEYIGNGETSLTVSAIQNCPEEYENCSKNNTVTDNNIVFTKKLLVSSSGEYTFTYELTPEEFKSCQDACYDCIYELNFTILDECGDLVKTDAEGTTEITPVSKMAVGTLDDLSNCSADEEVSETLTCYLPVGSYTVSKKLTVKEDAIDTYFEENLKSCVKTLDDFRAEELAKVDKENACEEVTCKSCLVSLNYSESQFDNKNPDELSYFEKQSLYNHYLDNTSTSYPLSFNEYFSAVNSCLSLCETVSNCQSSYNMMLSDVSPGGQYAVFEEESEHWSLSIFNNSNFLPNNRNGNVVPSWRKPVGYYLNEDNSKSYIVLTPKISNRDIRTAKRTGNFDVFSYDSFDPSLEESNFDFDSYIVFGRYNEYNEFVEDPDGDLFATFPQYLGDEEEFRKNWKASWAKALVGYHPEYCYYESCLENENDVEMDDSKSYSSADFDARLLAIETFEDAAKVQLKLINDGGATDVSNPLYNPDFDFKLFDINSNDPIDDLVDKDPFFKINSGLKSEFITTLTEYRSINNITLSIAEFAALTTRCGTYYYGTNSLDANCTSFGSGNDSEDLNNEWALYKTIYLSEKQKLQQKIADKNCRDSNIGGYNACIGSEDFDPFSSNFVKWENTNPFLFYNCEFAGACEPCGWKTFKQYENKVKRFSRFEGLNENVGVCDAGNNNLLGIIEQASKTVNLEHYLKTGQCPLARDFEGLLNDLASENTLNSTESERLLNYDSFTKTLYDFTRFGENENNIPDTEDAFSVAYKDYYWECQDCAQSTLNNSRTYVITDGVSSGVSLATTLTFSPGQTVSYVDDNSIEYIIPVTFDNTPDYTVRTYHSNVNPSSVSGGRFEVNVVGVRNLLALDNSDPNNFICEAVVEVLDNGNVVQVEYAIQLRGESEYALNNCNYYINCQLSEEAKDLKSLLSAIAANEDFSSDNVLLTDGGATGDNIYSSFFTQSLESYASCTNGTDFVFDTQVSIDTEEATKTITVNIHPVGELSNPLSINLVTGTNIDFSEIINFSCIRDIESTPLNYSDFELTGVTEVNGEIGFVSIEGSVSSCNSNSRMDNGFRINHCEPLIPSACKTTENRNVKVLNQFLINLVDNSSNNGRENFAFQTLDQTGNLTNIDLSTNIPFISGLKEQLNSNNDFVWGNINTVESILQASIEEVIDGGEAENTCPVSLVFEDPSLGVSFGDIVGFGTDLTPEEGFNVTNNFTVTAIYYDDVDGIFKTTNVQGSSCFSLANCNDNCVARKNNLLSNGSFSNPGLKFEYDSDYSLELVTSMEAGKGRLTRSSESVNSSWKNGFDPITNDGYFLVIDQNSTERMWYTAVNVIEGQTYSFSCLAKNLWAHGYNPSFSFYVAYNDENNQTVKDILGNETGDIEYSEGWRKFERAFTANITGEVEIGVEVADVTITYMNEEELTSGEDIGLDNFEFNEICTPKTPILPTITYEEPSCEEYLENIAELNAQNAYDNYISRYKNNFKADYLDKCLSAKEELIYEYKDNEFHRTLYYYDQAGNLVKTVPPKGVEVIESKDVLDDIKQDRFDSHYDLNIQPPHSMATEYTYNSLNQLVNQSVPDHEKMKIWETSDASSEIPENYRIKDVQFTNGIQGWALAVEELSVDENDSESKGRILVTHDGGTNWTELSKVGSTDINELQYVNSSYAYAVTKDGSLLKSLDGGDSWISLRSPSSEPLVGLYFPPDSPNPLTGRVFSADGSIYKTLDGGVSWLPENTLLSSILTGTLQEVSFTSTGYGNAVSKDEDNGYLYTSNDFGESWSLSTNIQGLDYNTVHIQSTGNGFAAGDNGLLLKTSDGGVNWNVIPTDTRLDFKKVYFRNTLDGVSIMSDNQIYISRNQGGKEWVLSDDLPSSDNFSDFYFYSDINGFAVSEIGNIYKTNSGGLAWEYYDNSIISGSTPSSVYYGDHLGGTEGFNGFVGGTGGKLWRFNGTPIPGLPVNGDVIDIHFVDRDIAYVVLRFSDSPSKLYKTLDATSSAPVWENVTPYNVGNIKCFEFVSPTKGYAVTSTGEILETSSDGLSWSVLEHVSSSPVSEINNISVVGTEAVVVGNSGQIFNTMLLGGSNWADHSDIIPGPLTGVYTVDPSAAYATGEGGAILKRIQNEWYYVPSTTNKNLKDVFVEYGSSINGFAVGESGIGLELSGSSWTNNFVTGEDVDFNSVVSPVSGTYYAVGNADVIYKNTGTGWTQINSNTSHTLNDVKFLDATNGLAVGNSGTILKFDGTNWTNVNELLVRELNATCRVPASTTTGYAVGNGGTILKTTDNGSSWNSLNSGITSNLHGVCFKNSETGIAVGADGKVLVTDNGGTSWEQKSSGGGDLLSVFIVNDNAIAVGNSGTILISSDKGSNWESDAAVPVSDQLNSVFMTSENIAYAVGNSGTIIKSKDAGLTWEILEQSPSNNWTTSNLYDVYFKDAVTGYAVGAGGTFLKTVNRGETWIIRDSEVAPQTNLYAVSGLGGEESVYTGGAGTVRSLMDMSDRISTRFWYDELGRLVISQNSKQIKGHLYSYTTYDDLGRVSEVGQVNHAVTPSTGNQVNYDNYLVWLSTGTKSEMVNTYYDQSSFSISDFLQDNLRTRVASVTFTEKQGDVYGGSKPYKYATHYSYDIHGNVKSVIQEFSDLHDLNQQFKRIDYKYDLISGNVNEVYYQKGKADQFIHKYYYDADNKLVEVQTSKDGYIWDKDAKYFYYDHGPLARVELGDLKVQGVDYAYTLQGWIKGVNSNTLNGQRDIGKDGVAGVNQVFPADEAGYTLGYFEGDYKAINNSKDPFEANAGSLDFIDENEESLPTDLYNGNISNMVTAIGKLMQGGSSPRATVYRYDQLNRLSKAQSHFDPLVVSYNNWSLGNTESEDYYEEFAYDENGNILYANRNGAGSDANAIGDKMDKLEYVYEHKDFGYESNTNKLVKVKDFAAANTLNEDFEGELDENGKFISNYDYDEIGNLIADAQEKIEKITWTVSGKVKTVERVSDGSHNKPDLEFHYDASGNRIVKIVKARDNGILKSQEDWIYTYYVRDVQGNVMAIYERSFTDGPEYTDNLSLQELPIYGSKRLGVKTFEGPVVMSTVPFTANIVDYRFNNRTNSSEPDVAAVLSNKAHRLIGLKGFEISNHLGNINVIVRDNKMYIPDNSIQEFTSSYEGDDFSVLGNYSSRQVSDKTNRGSSAIKMLTPAVGSIAYGPEYRLEVFPGDKIEVEVMAYFENSGLDKGGPLLAGLKDQSGNWVQGYLFRSDNHGNEPHTTPNEWKHRKIEEFTVPDYPSGVTSLEVIARPTMYSNQENTWYDDFKIKITSSTGQQSLAADVKSYSDYYAFGGLMPGRHFSGPEGYRYGFQGMEKDDEVKGSGNSYTTEFRQYDPRIGKWLSVDPLFRDFPWQSPYAGLDNNPTNIIDPTGQGGQSTHTDEDGNVIAVKDDGDLGVYKHAGKGQNALSSVNNNYSASNTSAGGQKMGETWTSLGFADFDKYESSGGKDIVPGPGARIDFSSQWATGAVDDILKINPSVMRYAYNAREGKDWDIKRKSPDGHVGRYYGSLLHGKYASARDAGNFTAGAVAQKSIVPNHLLDYGFGTYNMSKNRVVKSLLMIVTDVSVGILFPEMGADIQHERATYGEFKLSKEGIEAGKQYISNSK